MDEITARLISCFSTVFPDTPESQIPHASTENITTWDSVAAITLMNVTEDEFRIRLDLDDLPELNSFEKMRGYVQQRL